MHEEVNIYPQTLITLKPHYSLQGDGVSIAIGQYPFVVSAICAIMDEINTEHNMKSIMPAGGGSVERAPDSQRTNASSKLKRRKYSFITHLHTFNSDYRTISDYQLSIRHIHYT